MGRVGMHVYQKRTEEGMSNSKLKQAEIMKQYRKCRDSIMKSIEKEKWKNITRGKKGSITNGTAGPIDNNKLDELEFQKEMNELDVMKKLREQYDSMAYDWGLSKSNYILLRSLETKYERTQ